MDRNIVILIVFLIFVVIVIIVSAVLIYKYFPKDHTHDPYILRPIEYPFKQGDQIRLSFVEQNTPSPSYSFYVVAPLSNYLNCASGFNALDAIIDFGDEATLTVEINKTDPSKFALKTQTYGYCFYSTVNNNKIITFGAEDSPTADNFWFKLARVTGSTGYIIIASDGSKIGPIAVAAGCYNGVIIQRGSGYQGLIMGQDTDYNPQVFYIANLTKPISLSIPVPGYNFGDGDTIALTFTNTAGKTTYLHTGCPDYLTTVTFAGAPDTDANIKWLVTMSSDRRAFALSHNGQYLQTSINMSAGEFIVSLVNISLGGTSLSNYDSGNYTNWFQIQNSFLITPLCNMAFQIDQANNLNCIPNSVNYPIRGVDLHSGSPISAIEF